MNLRAATLGLFFTTAMLASVTLALQKDSGSQMVFRPEKNTESFDVKANDRPSLSDLLTVDRSLSLFYSYLRESTGLVERLANPLSTTTIFAPVDSSIINLARKPHQGPPPSGEDRPSLPISTEDQEKEQAAFLERWTKSHIVAGTDIDFKAETPIETLAGADAKLTFVSDAPSSTGEPQDQDMADWQRVLVLPGNAKIVARKEGKDGLIYVVDKVLQPEA